MIDWCSVNGALQKTLSVPGPVTVPLAAVPGPGPEEHCMHVICNLARRAVLREEHEYEFTRCFLWAPGDCGWVSGCLHHSATCRGSHTCLITLHHRENVMIVLRCSPPVTGSLCHPGPVHQRLRISQFSRLADKLARWLMTDHHLSHLSSGDICS